VFFFLKIILKILFFKAKDEPVNVLTNWLDRFIGSTEIRYEYQSSREPNKPEEYWTGSVTILGTKFETVTKFRTQQRAKKYVAVFVLYALQYFNPNRSKI
jgi:hypothetical protein